MAVAASGNPVQPFQQTDLTLRLRVDHRQKTDAVTGIQPGIGDQQLGEGTDRRQGIDKLVADRLVFGKRCHGLGRHAI